MRGCRILLLPAFAVPAILQACDAINGSPLGAPPATIVTCVILSIRDEVAATRGRQRKALMETMKVDRRKFLAGVAGAGAASTVAAPQGAAAAPAVKFPSAAASAAETLVPAALPASAGRPGSDRSEERRVGKEARWWGGADGEKKQDTDGDDEGR